MSTPSGRSRPQRPVDLEGLKAARECGLGLEQYNHYEAEEIGAGMQQLVNVANGNPLLRWTPFESPGRGLATVLDITYNSLEKKSGSPIGENFSLSVSGLTRFGEPLDIHPNKADEIAGRSKRFVEFTDGDGTTHRFTGRQAADGSISWDEPAGVHLYLRSLPDTDTRGKWALTRPDRTKLRVGIYGRGRRRLAVRVSASRSRPLAGTALVAARCVGGCATS